MDIRYPSTTVGKVIDLLSTLGISYTVSYVAGNLVRIGLAMSPVGRVAQIALLLGAWAASYGVSMEIQPQVTGLICDVEDMFDTVALRSTTESVPTD